MDSSKWQSHPRLASLGEAGEVVAEHEKFTPELQQRRAFRANKPYIPREFVHNSEASVDGILHFASGIGDDNPLFRDKAYAGKTKYGKIIAPGAYLYSVHWTPRGAGASGLHGWYSGGDWEFYRPIVVGDQFKVVCIMRDLVEKHGRMGGGRTWVDYTDVIYVNQRNEIVAKECQHTVRAERSASGSSGKNRSTPKPVYTREDWVKILDMYDKEEVRGSQPRYWDDVQVGDKVGPMVKGPLSVRDEIAWLMGAGSLFMKAHKMEFAYEMRHPKALEYVKETGEADVPELVHIFDSFARTVGVERAYDYGCQRMSWLCNFYTNWMGDDGFLARMSGDLRAFNQMGDTTFFSGQVTRKFVEDGRHCVEIEAEAKNQRGDQSMPPRSAIVALPTRASKAFAYPEPPASLVAEVKKARPLNELIAEGLI